MEVPRPGACDRARWYASLEADAELSQLERALLDAHVRRCPPCAAFRAEVIAIAAGLRHAPLEPLPAPLAVRARAPRRAGLVPLRAATAAAAMLLVGLGTVLSVVSSEEQRSLRGAQPRDFMSMTQLEHEIALIQRAGPATVSAFGGSSIAV